MFKFEKRYVMFEGAGDWENTRSLILKEGISNGISEVFVFLG
jgi:hypothetical protein